MSFTKTHIIKSRYNTLGCRRTSATKPVVSIVQTIEDALETGESILFFGIGKYHLKGRWKNICEAGDLY